MAAENTEAEQKDSHERKSAWLKYGDGERRDLEALCGRYEDFLSECKTERESVERAVQMAQKAGYADLRDAMAQKRRLKAGDKVYFVNMGKSMVLFNLGSRPLEEGMAILGAHIDSCRLDVKQNPLYEEGGLALLDTHYYGGIKKYQWVAMPLALHGVAVKEDGTKVEIRIGEEPGDPVFCVTDLLIHLAQEQMKKSGSTVVEGENLDILFGSEPLKGRDKEAVKAGVLKLISDKYGLKEDDFISAELCLVPAGRARDLGLDRSMILSYGHDDRVCAYTSLEAMLAEDKVERTTCCLLVDKEEIGSVGATGMRSRFFENALCELMALTDGGFSELSLRRALENSRMLSSDVSSAYDPIYKSAFDPKNTAWLGRGMVFNKFTGARGKSGSNDANAEFVAKVRAIMDGSGVSFQFAELGKVDLGGGGTIAYIMSLYGMQVIDSGVAVLSMHAPWEAVSKADVYETCRGYRAFLQKA
jgi:aspartyl aminopeptidase